MSLLTDELMARLPPLFGQEAEDEPYVYAKLVLPGTTLAWYVLEGENTRDGGFVMRCFFQGAEDHGFDRFPESLLEQFRGPNGEVVQRDETFTEGKLTDVVPAPDS